MSKINFIPFIALFFQILASTPSLADSVFSDQNAKFKYAAPSGYEITPGLFGSAVTLIEKQDVSHPTSELPSSIVIKGVPGPLPKEFLNSQSSNDAQKVYAELLQKILEESGSRSVHLDTPSIHKSQTLLSIQFPFSYTAESGESVKRPVKMVGFSVILADLKNYRTLIIEYRSTETSPVHFKDDFFKSLQTVSIDPTYERRPIKKLKFTAQALNQLLAIPTANAACETAIEPAGDFDRQISQLVANTRNMTFRCGEEYVTRVDRQLNCLTEGLKGFFVTGLGGDLSFIKDAIVEGGRAAVSSLPFGEWILNAFGEESTQQKVAKFVEKWGPMAAQAAQFLYRFATDANFRLAQAATLLNAIGAFLQKALPQIQYLPCDKLISSVCSFIGWAGYEAVMTVAITLITAEAGGAGGAAKGAQVVAKLERTMPRLAELLESLTSTLRNTAKVAKSAEGLTATEAMLAKGPKGLIGQQFEEFLAAKFNGSGSFKHMGREFDGAFKNAWGEGKTTWFEAKSGNYWNMISEDPSKIEKFKSDLANHRKIAIDAEKEFRLFSNTPIPNDIKQWLLKKGIAFQELLE